MNITELNTQFSIPKTLNISEGKGGFPFIRIHNAHASATISVYGGQVVQFKPHDATDDLMFLSDCAYYEPGKAIKGGAPICWPWFGPDRTGQNRGAHGFARNSMWRVTSTQTLNDEATEVILTLKESESSLTLWPHTFELTLKITVGKALTIALNTHNTSDTPMTITQAIHTYFKVGEASQTQVTGLESTQYIDNAQDGNHEIKSQNGAVTFNKEVDRIYQNTPATLQLMDSTLNRQLNINSTGSRTTVVWNPWAILAEKSPDLYDDDYHHFVCVETANAAEEIVHLLPNAHNELTATYTIQSR